ncbi:hypothetical protein ACRBEV_22645 [Methylobacterium phyllosphaerae]
MRKKTITITAMNRPEFFDLMIQSLVRNDLNGWEILVSLEPTDKTGEFHKICAERLMGHNYSIRVNEFCARRAKSSVFASK